MPCRWCGTWRASAATTIEACTDSVKRLIVNADDFGFSAGVTRGILEAHAAGTVTSTSVIVNMPASEDSVRQLRGAPMLGAGLHLNFTCGRPMAPADQVASLIDRRSGGCHPLPALLVRAFAGRIDPGQVALESTAQLNRLLAEGVAVTHIDSHR